MNNIFINGSIGYIYLKNSKNSNNNIKILLLSDNHSSQKYCSGNNKFISECLSSKNSKVLLEEVPQFDNDLVELWSTPHEQKLKELYLKNKDLVDGVDVRPLLVKFSIEIFKLQIKLEEDYLNNIKKINLSDYLKIIDSFFDIKHEYFIKTLGYTYTNLNGELLNHFNKLKNIFINIKNQFKNQMNEIVINLIQKDDVLLEKISYLLSCIMEWYTIAKISYYNTNKNKINKFIIHAGLDHTTNLNKLLIDQYGYEIVNSDGEIDINKITDDENNCLKLPVSVDSQFGGYFEKYRKYKAKYVALKRQYI